MLPYGSLKMRYLSQNTLINNKAISEMESSSAHLWENDRSELPDEELKGAA